MIKVNSKLFILVFCMIAFMMSGFSQETRLLRQPDLGKKHIAFCYGSDIWISNLETNEVKRLTSTSATERDPHISPDGKFVAFTSSRAGTAVYIVPIEGGEAKRLTWHPDACQVRGWTNDGKKVLYASTRETAPSGINRLWTISKDGGVPELLTHQWSYNGSFSPNGKQIVIDRMGRWDVEWRAYRGGQNTPLIILNLSDMSETLLPNEKTTDINPIWMGDKIYFLSDRDWCSNIWAYTPKTKKLEQITKFQGSDIKWISGLGNTIAYERDGYIHLYDLNSNKSKQLNITVKGDFPWAAAKWKEFKFGSSVGISPKAKRAIMEVRGDVFTVPMEKGDSRNITQSSGAADRAPIWSPKGDKIAWFSDKDGKGYALYISDQDGQNEKKISIGESKLAWEPTWSPDGKLIAFCDDDVRIRIVDIEKEMIMTADVGGNNLERGRLGLVWAKDSEWLAYAKSGSNNFKQIMVYNHKTKQVHALTDPFADSFSPCWDLNGKHLYFLASTNVALGSGWANTSTMTAPRPSYAAYVINLQKEEDSPFKAESDEEEIKEEDKDKDKEKAKDKKGDKATKGKKNAKKKNGKTPDAKAPNGEDAKEKKVESIKIDFDRIDRRIMALPVTQGNYRFIIHGTPGTVFLAISKGRSVTLQKFELKSKKAKDFTSGVSQVVVTPDGTNMLAYAQGSWKLMNTKRPNGKSGKTVKINLQMKVDYAAEWEQIFNEAWRYERDYFYDPNLHGRDWNKVYERYAPLIPYVKHRADLNYILDQMNGELSVGHSFVRGGEYPRSQDVREGSKVGMLGVDLVAENGRWKIKRIFTTESWNPRLSAPLDQPGMKVKEGDYIVAINGMELTAKDNPFKYLDGTVGKQTTLHINKEAKFKGSWKEVVKPIRSERGLRQRAWVEDNRRLVDKLSGGRLAYVWVPNTGGPGFVSFNRYYFAQQDKEGAVIDERFNGGGLLDDYMVDLMTRSIRAGLTNEVPNGKAMRLPAGILGPKVLLINELAGSGGDFFPWVFRQQKAGPLVGMTTWGGLVKSSTHYRMIDGGSLTAPDNAVFDPINNKWIAENEGVAPDIEVRQDAKSLAKGKDPQLERAVKEALRLLNKQKPLKVIPPPFSTPAKKK